MHERCLIAVASHVPPVPNGSWRGSVGAACSPVYPASSAASGNVCPVDDFAEAAVVGIAVPLGYIPADLGDVHALGAEQYHLWEPWGPLRHVCLSSCLAQ
jgi:hypothetical protein